MIDVPKLSFEVLEPKLTFLQVDRQELPFKDRGLPILPIHTKSAMERVLAPTAAHLRGAQPEIDDVEQFQRPTRIEGTSVYKSICCW